MSENERARLFDPEKEPEKVLGGASLRVGLLVLAENRALTDKLVRSAVSVLLTHRVSEGKMRIMWSPSAFTLPLLAKSMAVAKEFDGLLILGVLVKDGTDRYYFETPEIYRALTEVMMSESLPIAPALLCVENAKEAARLVKKKDALNPGIKAATDLVEIMLS